ncbi:hypothetical protein KHF85_03170 [Xanthomonas translucens pv. graminis]|uniref:hypothetical protein n=1 Tax=Xanthomonas graminis TaxID=3390026 RepID=UPI00254097AB|nr:hypothetical protein [Xanthomonas translucens]WIH05517.1 hypothetical protein KHF85_03170 [Xanthomonas translucens pv. graminis]
MIDPEKLGTFNLSDPEDRARFDRIHTPRTGDRLSSSLRRTLDELLAGWNQPAEVIQRERDLVERSLAHMDAIEEQAGGALAALHHPLMAVAMVQASAAVQLLAREPYVRAARAAIEARAAGGRAKARNNGAPPGHAAVVKAARRLQAAGEPDRDLVRLLAQEFRYSDDTIRRVLQKNGVLPASRSRNRAF